MTPILYANSLAVAVMPLETLANAMPDDNDGYKIDLIPETELDNDIVVLTCRGPGYRKGMLMMVTAYVKSADGASEVPLTVLLDTASEVSFITARAANLICHMPEEKVYQLTVEGAAGLSLPVESRLTKFDILTQCQTVCPVE